MSGNELLYRALLREELRGVEGLLHEVHDQVPTTIGLAVRALILSGGKRLRPALVLLSAHLCGAALEHTLPVAAATEMLHTATLIHDDLIDNAILRRGVETLNAHWSPAATVLTGDIAFAWAARLSARGQSLRIMERFAETLNIICRGELTQMFVGRDQLPTLDDYYVRIYAKTASLFEFTTEAGAILGKRPAAEQERLARFGKLLGLAFQISDDVLDFMADEATLGKPVGSDLQQGLITLPVLYYLEEHPEDGRIAALMRGPREREQVQAIVADLRRSAAADRAMVTAEGHIHEALALLATYPASPYLTAMQQIANFAVQRTY